MLRVVTAIFKFKILPLNQAGITFIPPSVLVVYNLHAGMLHSRPTSLSPVSNCVSQQLRYQRNLTSKLLTEIL